MRGGSSPRPQPDRTAPLYNTWHNELQRCGNPNNPQYPDYGGRGLQVAEEFKAWPEGFVRWCRELGVGPDSPAPLDPYGAPLTVDRIDNNRGYGPGNLR